MTKRRSGWNNAASATNGKAGGRPATGVRADVGADAMTQLGALAAAEGCSVEALAVRWLGERIAAEWLAYERERGIGADAPPASEWNGEVL